jgi:hypothetical protein
MFAAKQGGTLNSLIPALLCAGAFCAWRSRIAFPVLSDPRRPLLLRLVLSVALAVGLLCKRIPEGVVLTHGCSFPGKVLTNGRRSLRKRNLSAVRWSVLTTRRSRLRLRVMQDEPPFSRQMRQAGGLAAKTH